MIIEINHVDLKMIFKIKYIILYIYQHENTLFHVYFNQKTHWFFKSFMWSMIIIVNENVRKITIKLK